MVIRGHCLCGCGQVLIGKQRKFSSDTCRKRYSRCPQMSANSPQLSGNVRDFSNSRTFQIVLVVCLESNLPSGKWDTGLINVVMRRKIAKLIADYIKSERPNWQISIKVDSSYQG
jgi:hypothetical protein